MNYNTSYVVLQRNNQKAYLKHVCLENVTIKRSWVSYPLALVFEDGTWAYSEYWRGNAFRKALKELSDLGWEIV